MRGRRFLGGWIPIVLLCAAATAAAQTPEPRDRVELPDARDPARPPRAAVFRAPGFPTVDAPPIDDATLAAALAGLPVDVLASAAEIRARLRLRAYDVLVLPYGSAFPVAAWPEIRDFLGRGGGLVVLGGAPFHEPIREGDPPGAWRRMTRQPTFARDLLIGPAEPVAVGSGDLVVAPRTPFAAFAFERPTTAWALTVRFTTQKDFDKEDGTSGPRDAILRPLVHVVDGGVPVACPLLEIDRLRGAEQGARWVLAPSDARLSADVIRGCVARALEGASQLVARPVRAIVDPLERVDVRVLLDRPATRSAATDISGRFARDGTAGATTFALSGPPESQAGVVAFEAAMAPGVHEFSVDVGDLRAAGAAVVRDAALMRPGPSVRAGRDWLTKDGRVFPVVGTTYMASDVHRKFLFEPNPKVWNDDFAAMRRHGVNFVRTGLWNSWSRAMLDPGAVDESVLDALEAYVQIAASHGIVTCFNFFAFQPPMHGGSNPYLDPRALEGQKALLVAVARRFRGCGWVHFDLINEPSYCPPDQLWTNRPIGDVWEKRAWAAWVVARLGDDPSTLRDRWLDGAADPLALPKADELSYTMIREHRRPRKARDFVRFTNHVVAEWAAELRQTLRSAAGSDVLVTLGQDEGGTHVRPAQQLHADAVDYTAIHTWWNNDDLLWDGVVTKVAGKPNLVQETGLMRLEDERGFPWRTQDDAANLLERKFAYAFMGRGCGAIEWAWNINPYMPIENEATIGIFRPDGTAKPELRVIQEFARFFDAAAPRLGDFDPDQVVLMLPHSRTFAGRPKAADSTRQIVRTLAERFGIVPAAVSEFSLPTDRLEGARLVIVPSPEALDPDARSALRDAAARGVKVLVTGALDRGVPVAPREPTSWSAPQVGPAWATYDGGQAEWLRKEEAPPLTRLEGAWWHEPLPLEFARETEPLRALLDAALAAAGVVTHPSAAPIAARVLPCAGAALVVVVNESSFDLVRGVAVDGVTWEIPVAAGRSRLVLLSRGPRAEVLVATPGLSITRRG